MAEYFGNICTCRRCNGVVHTIKRGDTLYLLSRHYNVTINDIMRANANINVYNLQVGDQICIPVRRPNPSIPNILGQILNPNQNQGQMQGRPTPIQPRDNDMDNNDANDRADRDDRMMRNAAANDMDMIDGESNVEFVQTAAEAQEEVHETAAECCAESSMRVRDLLKDENMTIEELARIIKNM
ncbi:MAG: LysM peptidoglycan-binding domain-containing protein [Lachnospiraceae bacterium]|nr:LysM peptidoglycan-binding domain-containing protein [Lachnospiraceae bacterium]